MEENREIFDLGAALDNMDGDQEMLKELTELFLMDCPNLMEAIRNAISAGDREELGHAAHNLKGSVSNFGARKAYQVALRLESSARESEDAQILPKLTEELEGEIERLRPCLQALLDD